MLRELIFLPWNLQLQLELKLGFSVLKGAGLRGFLELISCTLGVQRNWGIWERPGWTHRGEKGIPGTHVPTFLSKAVIVLRGAEGQSNDPFWSSPLLLTPSLISHTSSLGSLSDRASPWLLVFHFSLHLN